MAKGRPLLTDRKLLSNGLHPDVDKWLRTTAKNLGVTYTELKRRIIVNYYTEAKRTEQGINDSDSASLELKP